MSSAAVSRPSPCPSTLALEPGALHTGAVLRDYLDAVRRDAAAAGRLLTDLREDSADLVGSLLAWAHEKAVHGGRPVDAYIVEALEDLAHLPVLVRVEARGFSTDLSRVRTMCVNACPADRRSQMQAQLEGLDASAVEAMQSSALLSGVALVQEVKPAAVLSMAVAQAMSSAKLVEVAGVALERGELDVVREVLSRLGATEEQVAEELVGALPDWEVRGRRVRHHTATGVRRVVRCFVGAHQGFRIGDRFARHSLPGQLSHARIDLLLQAAAASLLRGEIGRATLAFDITDEVLALAVEDRRQRAVLRRKALGDIELAAFDNAFRRHRQHIAISELMSHVPGYDARALIKQLAREDRRAERGRLIELALMHGESIRDEALQVLRRQAQRTRRRPLRWWVLRNLIHIVRHTQSDHVQSIARRRAEIRLVAGFGGCDRATQLQREVVLFLGEQRSALAEGLLEEKLDELSAALAEVDDCETAAETRRLWVLALEILIKSGRPEARRSAITRIVSDFERFDYSAPLAQLGSKNLSTEPETVALLVRAVRNRLRAPGLLGRVRRLPRADAQAVRSLLTALKRTPSPEVFGLLDDLRAGGNQELAVAAADLAASLSNQPSPVAAQTAEPEHGEVAPYALPGLFQRFEAGRSGELFLDLGNGALRGRVQFENGCFLAAACGRSTGSEALYALLEQPLQGEWRFFEAPFRALAKDIASKDTASSRKENLDSLIGEGLRRYEARPGLRMALASTLPMIPVVAKPTIPRGEPDGMLLNDLWTVLRSGADLATIEERVRAPQFRVLRALAFWLEREEIVFANQGIQAAQAMGWQPQQRL